MGRQKPGQHGDCTSPEDGPPLEPAEHRLRRKPCRADAVVWLSRLVFPPSKQPRCYYRRQWHGVQSAKCGDVSSVLLQRMIWAGNGRRRLPMGPMWGFIICGGPSRFDRHGGQPRTRATHATEARPASRCRARAARRAKCWSAASTQPSGTGACAQTAGASGNSGSWNGAGWNCVRHFVAWPSHVHTTLAAHELCEHAAL